MTLSGPGRAVGTKTWVVAHCPAQAQRARVSACASSSWGQGRLGHEQRGCRQASWGNPEPSQILPGESVTFISAYTPRETGCFRWEAGPRYQGPEDAAPLNSGEKQTRVEGKGDAFGRPLGELVG